ncbi:MAG: sensor histidine kinase, partial [Acidobacteria bacterium]|nr:sensor histidine kinase [Acidobacteriota bacterium]
GRLAAALPRECLAPRTGPADLSALQAVHGNMMRNYFRLLRAERELARRAPRSVVGAAEIAAAQLELERARLAHELHAGAGQALAGIKIHLEILDTLIPDPPPQVRNSLHRIGLLAQEALQQLRSITQRIHPPDWQRLGLRAALETLWTVSGIADKYQASLELRLEAEPSHAVRVLLYRAAQEGLANIVRHAQATRVRLALEQADGHVHLTVEDNGKGFDQVMMDRASGIGIRSLRNQTRLLNGRFEVRSGGGGTTLMVSVPLAAE